MALVKLNNVRLAFPALWTPKSFAEGEPKFQATPLILKTDKANLTAVQTAIVETAKAKWADKADSVLKSLSAGGKTCLRDGDLKEGYDGFDGCMFVSVTSGKRPLVIDRDRNVLGEADGKPYAGCFVNITFDVWAQDNKYGKRINATLRGVQFVGDGDAFSGGGAPASVDEFDDLSDTGELTADFNSLV